MRREYMYREFEDDKSLDQSNYLTVVALVDGFAFYVYRFALGDIQYRISGNDNWEDLVPLKYIPTLYKYQYIQFRGRTNSCCFKLINDCKLTGDYSSLWRWSGSNNPDDEFIELEEPDQNVSGAMHAVFEDCVGIKEVSEGFLRYTGNLPPSCYGGLFKGCTSLKTAPELPATTLSNGCYSLMFYGCTSLETPPPELPAKVLTNECYLSMFEGCTRLKSIPKIRAEELHTYTYIDQNNKPYDEHSKYCCRRMFKDCINLEEIPSTYDLVFSSKHDYYGNFNSMFEGCTGLKQISKTFLINGVPDFTDNDKDGAIDDIFTHGPRQLCGMFRNCTSLTEAPILAKPGYQAGGVDYSYMFYGCTKLKNAPRIEVYRGYGSRFSYMFGNCTSLEIPPIIICTNTDGGIFKGMFYGCTKLKISPLLHCLHTDVPYSAFDHMFYGCTSLESTYQVLPSTHIGADSYHSMYKGCSSLKNVPILPATDLPYYGYYVDMFNGCSKINSVRSYHKSDVGNYPYNLKEERHITQNWLDGTSETGIFYKNEGATWHQYNNDYNSWNFPAGWNIVAETPKTLVRIDHNEGGFWWNHKRNTNSINSDLTITIMYSDDIAKSMDDMKTDTVIMQSGSERCSYPMGDKIIYNITVDPLVDEENIYYIVSDPYGYGI